MGMHRGTRQPCRHLEVRRSARRPLSPSRGAALSTARVDPVVAPAREAPSARGRLDVPLPIARRILETSVA